ncbi:MAG: insulinase family protein [Bacteroidales bacterium]|nr:insulinase family protein [Bacteroidales bacterium]
MKKFQLLLVLAFISFSTMFAQTDLNQAVPNDPNVVYGKLENGMTYYIRHNETPKNRAELTIITKAGSVFEDEDQRGLAHFCEHMSFNGTKNFPKHELVDFLERTGMKFGAEVNAYTSFDETVYGITVPLDSADFLDKGLLVLHDWAYLASLDGEEIDAERGVIHEEWRMHQGAQSRMQDELLGAIFKDSKYAERLPIGLMSVVDSCEYDVLRRFYKDWYTPNRQAVIVVGDFDIAVVEQKIKDLFGKIPAVENPREYVQVDIPDNKEPIIAVMSDKENPSTAIQIFIKHDKFNMKNVGDYRRSIAQDLYNEMINKRLQELTLSENPPFVYGYAGYGEFIGPKDVYVSIAATKENGIIQGTRSILEENFRVKQHGFTATELEREKKSLLKKIEKLYNDRNKQKSQDLVNEYKANFLSEVPFPGIENEYKYYQEFVNQITLDEVNALSKEWITDENMVVLAVGIDKEGVTMPTKEELANLINEVKNQKLEPYVDKVSTRPLFEDKLIESVGKVDKKAKLKDFDATEWTLSNGVKVVLKTTDFKDDEINMTAYSYGGYSLYGQDDDVSSKIAADIILESGLNGFDKVELEKLLSDKTVSVSPYIGELSEGFNGSSSVQDFEMMLQLINLYFSKPRYDETAYKSYIERMKSMYENQSVSPENAFRDSIASVLSSHSKRARPMSAELLSEADYKRVHKIYRERFNDPGSFTFFFVGNIDQKTAKPLIEKYLGSLSAVNNNEQYKDLGITYPKGKVDVQAKKGTEPKSIVFIQINHDFAYDLKDRVGLKALGKILSIELIDEIREKNSLVYSIGAYPNYEKVPTATASMTIYFPCSPDKIETATNGSLAIFKAMMENGPSEVNLNKAKQQLLKEQETNLRENKYWLNSMKSYYFDQEPTSNFNEVQKVIESLTAEDIKAIAKKYINDDNFVRIALVPEN